MPIVIPEEDGGFVKRMLISEDAECCCAEPEMARPRRREAQPAGGQNAEKVAVAEEDDASAGPFEASHDAVGPDTDRLDRLSARRAVAEQIPARSLGADLGRRPALVGAVVPLQQVGLLSASRTEASELARPASPLERADNDEFEGFTFEPLAQAAGVGFPRGTSAGYPSGRCAAARSSTPSRRAAPGRLGGASRS